MKKIVKTPNEVTIFPIDEQNAMIHCNFVSLPFVDLVDKKLPVDMVRKTSGAAPQMSIFVSHPDQTIEEVEKAIESNLIAYTLLS